MKYILLTFVILLLILLGKLYADVQKLDDIFEIKGNQIITKYKIQVTIPGFGMLPPFQKGTIATFSE